MGIVMAVKIEHMFRNSRHFGASLYSVTRISHIKLVLLQPKAR